VRAGSEWCPACNLGALVMLGTLFGRVEAWSDSRTKSRLHASLLSIASIVATGHAVYLSVFAPHLATKVLHLQTVGPTEQLFEGVPNQPL